jgi:uncharacterized protein YjdB
MPFRRSLIPLAACLWAVVSLSCGDGGSDLSGPDRIASLALTPATATLERGQTLQLVVDLRDREGAALTGHRLTWSTSNDAVAAVSSAGLVTAVGDGAAGITVTVEGRSVTSRITVRPSIAVIEITPESPTVAVGRTVQLTAVARGSAGTVLAGPVFEWISSDPRIAAVGVGKVRGIRPGSAEIEAKADGKSGTTTVTVVPASEPPADPR